ncbi:MAG TPA: hypothetical protein VGT03_10410 [Candidatus Acidoferrales bacterium]|nr:hypothetical protein [Candidatus Acidoferrales bacterium]
MRHFVQYHNPGRMGEYKPPENGYFIFTDKTVDCHIGDKVWLISRRGRPGNYEFVVCQAFLVETIEDNSGDFRYSVRGTVGQHFDPPITINEEPWFERLRVLDGNFAFGLQPINEPEVVSGLSKLGQPS